MVSDRRVGHAGHPSEHARAGKVLPDRDAFVERQPAIGRVGIDRHEDRDLDDRSRRKARVRIALVERPALGIDHDEAGGPIERRRAAVERRPVDGHPRIRFHTRARSASLDIPSPSTANDAAALANVAASISGRASASPRARPAANASPAPV